MIVLTGVSGSGKSSHGFDTLYAEGQRRHLESLSTFGRQFIGQMEKPKVDFIGGLRYVGCAPGLGAPKKEKVCIHRIEFNVLFCTRTKVLFLKQGKLAVAHLVDHISVFHNADIVGDEDHGVALLVGQVRKNLDDHLAIRHVQVAGRFVG